MNNTTFALYLAEKGIIPPHEVFHDPTLYDKWGNTVANYLISKNI